MDTDETANSAQAAPESTGVLPSSPTFEGMEHAIQVLTLRSAVMENLLRQDPHRLPKFTSELIAGCSDLEVRVQRLVPQDDPRIAEFRLRISQIQKLATTYFEASIGLDTPYRPSDTSPASSSRSSSGNSAGADLFKLRKCAPPEFSGHIRDFPMWWEHFSKAVHENETLSNTHRMIHLLASMKGDAKEFMSGFQATGETYPIALKAVRERFGDPVKLAQCYYADLAGLPDLADMPDVPIASDRANLDKIKTLIIGLRGTGQCDTELTQGWIIRKLSTPRIDDAFLRLSLQFPRLNFDLDQLLEALEASVYTKEVIKLRAVQVTKPPEDTESTRVTTLSNRARGKPTHGNSSSSSKNTPSCLFCGNKHASTDCKTMSTYEARKQRVIALGRCLTCLSADHRSQQCPSKARPCRNCSKNGHPSPLCYEAIKRVNSSKDRTRKKARRDEPKGSGGRQQPHQSTSRNGNNDSGTFLETFISEIVVGGRSTRVRGLLDGGSDASYILDDVLRRLDVNLPRSHTLEVQSYGNAKTSLSTAAVVEVTFLSPYNDRRISCTLYSTDCIISNPSLSPPPTQAESLLPYGMDYADSDLFSPSKRTIEILIGNDLRNLFMKINRDRVILPGLLLKPTFFGWVPSGQAVGKGNRCTTLTTVKSLDHHVTPSSKVEFLRTPSISFLWDLEILGIRPSETNSTDDVVVEFFRKTARLENNRFVVCWPRRVANMNLPSNFKKCFARLKGLLRKTPSSTLEQYDKVIQEQLRDGVVEPAPPTTRYLVHYLPHKGVFKGDKLRIVFDGSAATSTGRSLNDMLHTGPPTTQNLTKILLNFRLRKIGITADIAKAFLQVGLDIADRDLVRFLWVENIHVPVDLAKIVHYRFTRTPFGVSSSPFLLNMVLSKLLSSVEDDPYLQLARNSFYVDNLVASVNNVKDAVEFFETVDNRLHTASFNLRDWASNSSEFIAALPDAKRMKDTSDISILGLNWNRTDDVLAIRIADEENPHSAPLTLRLALSVQASVYDPMGIVAPSMLDLKAFVQQCWKLKVGWNDLLPVTFEPQFRKLLVEREEIKSLNFPRYLWSASSRGSYELHVFCDASKRAYACAAYLVHRVQPRGEAQIIFTKVRIAPIQPRTIPQLELLALLIGKRTATFLRDSLDLEVDRTVLWTDATTVLQWLNSHCIQAPFVQNRLEEIRKAVNMSIRYTPTKDNPADILSRGLRASLLKQNELYWQGPYWLTNERMWPSFPENTIEFSANLTQVVTIVARHRRVSSLTRSQTPFISDEFEGKFSTWPTYVRYILRLPPVSKWHSNCKLTPSESYKRAELSLLHLIQRRYFRTERDSLSSGSQISSDLNLFLHTDGLIRCRGRLEMAPLAWEAANPIYLPRDSELVRKLIFYVHCKSLHAGVDHTLTTFRERFWITRAKALVSSVIHKCIVCRRWRGGPFKLPPMAPLPKVRLAPISPFVNVGVDCFGPLYIRPSLTAPTTLSVRKVYGVIFVCLVTRAIHLELSDSLSGDHFLQVLISFTSRRGTPKFLVSDNGKNFVFIQALLGEKVKLRDSKIEDFLNANGMDWHFIPAYCPWYGGAYERLISLVKSSLLKAVGSRIVDHSTLRTVLCQIENVVNSRPLTSSSATEILQPLTPNHFLRPLSNLDQDSINLDPSSLNPSASKLLTGFKLVHSVLEHFQTHFKSRYFQFLREKHVALHTSPKGAAKHAPKIGDVVLVRNQYVSRAKWPLGIIEGLDARGAQAEVKIIDWSEANKLRPAESYRTKIVQVSVKSLYPLEIPLEESVEDSPPAKVARLASDLGRLEIIDPVSLAPSS